MNDTAERANQLFQQTSITTHRFHAKCMYRRGYAIVSVLTWHINNIDTADVCRHQNLHREDVTPLAAYVITGNTVIITVLFRCATV